MKTGPRPEDQPFANPLNLPAESQKAVEVSGYAKSESEHHRKARVKRSFILPVPLYSEKFMVNYNLSGEFDDQAE